MKKVNAFTLLEMVIVMIITSFLFIAGYMAYSSSIKRLSFFELHSAKNVDISQLDLLLTKDIQEAVSVSLPDPARLSIINVDGKETIYFFNTENVIRQLESQTDTFNVNISSVNGQPLQFDRKYINRLNILTSSDMDTISLDYEKTYDPSFMMNHDNL